MQRRGNTNSYSERIDVGKRGIMFSYAAIMASYNGTKDVPDGVEAPYLERKDIGVKIPISAMMSDGQLDDREVGRALGNRFVFYQPTETGIKGIAYDMKKGEALVAENYGKFQPVTMDQIRSDIDDIQDVIDNTENKKDLPIDEDNVTHLFYAIDDFDGLEAAYNKLVESRKDKPRALDTKEGRQTMLDMLAYHVKLSSANSNYSYRDVAKRTPYIIETVNHKHVANPSGMRLGDIKRRLVAGDVFVHRSSFHPDGSYTSVSFDKNTGQVNLAEMGVSDGTGSIYTSFDKICGAICSSVKNDIKEGLRDHLDGYCLTSNPRHQESYLQLVNKAKSYVDEHEDIINDLITDDRIDSYCKELYNNERDYSIHGDNSREEPNGSFDYEKYQYIQKYIPERRMPAGLSDIEPSDDSNYQLD